MRTKRTAGVLVAVLTVTLLPALTVVAHHDPQAGDVVTEAVAQGMQCVPASGQQACTALRTQFPTRRALITPDTGPLQSVTTTVNASVNSGYYMFSQDEAWNVALHDVGCNDPNAVGAFISDLGADHQAAFMLGPVVAGECSITGWLINPISTNGSLYYKVTSTTLSSAFPTPTGSVPWQD